MLATLGSHESAIEAFPRHTSEEGSLPGPIGNPEQADGLLAYAGSPHNHAAWPTFSVGSQVLLSES